MTTTSFNLSWSDRKEELFSYYIIDIHPPAYISVCENNDGNCTFLRNATNSVIVSRLDSGTLYQIDVYTLIEDQVSEPLHLKTYTGYFDFGLDNVETNN